MIRLDGLNLGNPPNDFMSFVPYISYLDMENNQLTAIPSGLNNNLGDLLLRGNPIDRISQVGLARLFLKVKYLRE